MSNRLIDLQHITKIYDGHKVLDDLNLYFNENKFLTLLGPRGCGKTTTGALSLMEKISPISPPTNGL